LDPRFIKLAQNLIHYSTALKPGEKILIENIGPELPLTKAIIREAYKVGAKPIVLLKNQEILREILLEADEEVIKINREMEKSLMEQMDAYIGIRAGDNIAELSDVPEEKIQAYQRGWWHPVHGEVRVPKTKWVVLRYPNASMAQLAGMSSEAFTDFYFNVCNLDYSKMSKAMDALINLMNRTDKVRITGPGTDITFSIKGIPAVKCDGHRNIPDGEVYTAPVKESVNGVITYNTPSVYQGYTFENVRLVVKDGRIIEATANNTEKLNKILDTDAGARYFGEFAIGVNPYITKPMKDTLFDEKIMGSIHFTPGSSYDEAFNGNKSAVHWDFVLIQTPEYGGGEIYFDDVLIRKDGIFVLPELEGLNPENLR